MRSRPVSDSPDGTGHRTRLRVRYAETDQMGVVYHTHYLVWCEVGRTDLLRSLGRPYAELEGAGLRLAVAAATVRYGGSARYDDVVEVVTRVAAAQSRMVTFAYDIAGVEPARGHLASAQTRLIALDGDGRPRRLPEDLLRLLGRVAAGTGA